VSRRYVCIHGHFYQPPRENPWLEQVEREESARPFHDWNERITHEAYAPNAFSRILDDNGRIDRIVNNYSRINFNFGPTLLAWMERNAPETYQAVLQADRLSRERFSGHGSAMAQAYNHMILPLANVRDQRTQIQWGIRDFEHRFGRSPEGMWLPETAVDVQSLELMAEAGIRFTVLAPHQALAVREEGGEWTETQDGDLDTSRSYRVPLPSGNEIAVFFYDGPLSQAVAFQQLLADGTVFAHRLLEAGAGHGAGGLTHIATDGETYGHHHRHGDMALAYALRRIEEEDGVGLTNYPEHLERHPPVAEARIREHSSWSCVHGTERWRSDCGCSTGAHPEWSQAWRAPLREAMDWLRDHMAPLYEAAMGEMADDPWGARDRYIDVVLDRSSGNVEAFLEREARRRLNGAERTRALKLLELQRHSMLTYTSCGWFFDDVSGIEILQVLKYAARALHLAEILFEDHLEEEFKERLVEARSNHPDARNGKDIYERLVEPSRVNLAKVAAHHAVSALFEAGSARERDVYCYTVRTLDEQRLGTGRSRLALGRLEVTSRITLSRGEMSYAVLHMGDHNLVGGVRLYKGLEAYGDLMQGIVDGFERGDFAGVIRTLDQEFQAATYSLRSLFRDEQERVVTRILDSSLAEAENVLADLYESRASLMRFLAELEISQPEPFRTAGDFVVNTRLERALSETEPDTETAEQLVKEARANRLDLNEEALEYVAGSALHRLLERLEADPHDRGRLQAVARLAAFAAALPFQPDLWWAQNTYFRLLDDVYPGILEAADREDRHAIEWISEFRGIGTTLGVAFPERLRPGVHREARESA